MDETLTSHNPTPSIWAQIYRDLRRDLVSDLQPDRLLAGLNMGFITGTFAVIMSISFAALIFSGELSGQVAFALRLTLLGAIFISLLVTLSSSHRSTIAVNQDATTALMAVVAAGALAAAPAELTSDARFFTILMLVLVTTMMTGILFLLIGRFRLGGMVRFLPYPVVGGFLAGTGWLLLVGAIDLMVDGVVGLALLSPMILLRWLPGLLFAIVLLIALSRLNHPLLLPGLFLTGIGLFYLAAWLTGVPLAELTAQGWLLSGFPAGELWRFPFTADNLTLVAWPVIFDNLGAALPVVFISVVMLLLNVSGQELVVKQDMDLDRELIAAGMGNVASGLCGGLIGFHAISLSSLNQRICGGSRVAGLVTAVLLLIALLLGPFFLAFLPKLILGGLLAFLALGFLLEWLVQGWRRFTRLEYSVIPLITLVVALFGFLQGVAVGLLAAVALFVINYSRVSVVKNALSGRTYRSRVNRNGRQYQTLAEQGEQIQILQLQGYLFFGTAHSLFEQIRAMVGRPDAPPVNYLLLDFRRVTGIDSTAMLSFTKIKQLVQDKGIVMLLTQLKPLVHDPFTTDDFLAETDVVRVFADMDRGVEWCEEQILRTAGATQPPGSLLAQLELLLSRWGTGRIGHLLPYLERRELVAGDYIVHEGDDPDDIYFVESGQVTAQLERDSQQPIRLETMRGGQVVGEIGFYLGVRRTASVVADQPSVIYRLSLDRLRQLERDDPETAVTFHNLIACLLAERASHLIRTADALLRG
jgi:sulfate permease, SulP family